MARKVAKEVEDVILEGLENNEPVTAQESAVSNTDINLVEDDEPDFTSLEWLKSHAPIFPADITSAKYNAEREPKVQSGCAKLAKIASINPLFVLLAKWWENKVARTTIKKAIDAEAAAKAIDPTIYIQEDLRNEVEKFEGLQDAVERMKYAITYFKPRTTKDVYKLLKIDGVVYNVNLTLMAQLKEKYGDDKATIKEELKKVSQPFDIIDEL